MIKKLITATLIIILLSAWVGAQAPKPGATPQPQQSVAPLPGKAPPPNLMPLIDTLYGLLAIEKSSTPLTKDQVKKIYAALQEANELLKAVAQKDTILKQILTPEQVKYIEDAKMAGKLKVVLPPVKPGENPVTAKAISILEKKIKAK
jgi:hypothetical protein